jgi:hypothetical protein
MGGLFLLISRFSIVRFPKTITRTVRSRLVKMRAKATFNLAKGRTVLHTVIDHLLDQRFAIRK